MANKTGKGGFKKGKSGNPAGRPKKGDTFGDILDEYILKTKDKDSTEWLVEKLAEHVDKGSLPALIEAINRKIGKVRDELVVEGIEVILNNKSKE